MGNVIIPRQPLWLFATTRYYKIDVMQYGISHFYTFFANEEITDATEVIPDGSVDIIFLCRENNPEAICYGTRLQVHKVNDIPIFKKGDYIFGVRFLPGNVSFLKGFPAEALIENAVDFTLIRKKKKMVDEICQCRNFPKQISIFMKEYLLEYKENREEMAKDKKIQIYLLQRILDSGGQVRVQDLSRETVFSKRYLNQLFHNEYGLSPKEFEKIIRLQTVLSELNKEEKIVDIACKAGYYDQSHLLKEFKQIMGISPSKYKIRLKSMDFREKLIVISSDRYHLF